LNFSVHLIGFDAALWGWLSLCALLVVGGATAQWRALIASSARQNVVLGCWLGLILLGAFHGNALPGVPMHYLGLTAVTLIIGWQFALLGGALAVFVLAGLNHEGFAAVGFAVWGQVFVPIAITVGINRFAQRFLPPNFFIYLFVNVFFAAVLGFIFAALVTAGLVAMLGVYSWSVLVSSYLAFIPIQVMPEAMINGMVMLGLTLLKPEWVESFDAQRYFKN
jgi:uncharacterized membrane protein